GSGSGASLPHALGAAGANPWRALQWLHDVPAGLDQLGSADHLAGDRAGCVLHLRPEAQQGANPAGERRKVVVDRWLLVDGRWPMLMANACLAKVTFRWPQPSVMGPPE